ncbi:hypothetical protein KR074_011943 [Drosophila pseudoananassae]|nr:hypothetical protein KR074_011943 [Drosophila pseudoananassae]
MAPRRNNNISSSSSGNSTQQHHQQHLSSSQQQQLQQHLQQQQYLSTVLMAPMQGTAGGGGGVVRCCLPSGDCRKIDTMIHLTEMSSMAECVRVLCNNENCNAGQYMHRECFEVWEAGVLQTLKASGRARSWSERQRALHLWTKKGYELVHKACSCKCGRGQLRKDLEWVAPPNATNGGMVYLNGSRGGTNGMNGNISEDDDKKKAKKKRNRNNNNNSNNNNQNSQKTPLSNNNGNTYGGLTPNPNVGVIGSGLPHNNNNNTGNSNNNNNTNGSAVEILQPSVVATLSNILNPNNVLGLDLRARAGSLSSSGAGSGSTSPSASQSSGEISVSPVQQLLQQQQQQSLLMQPLGPGFGGNLMQNGLGLSKNLLIAPLPPTLPALANVSNFKPLASYEQQQLVQQQKNKEVELYSERVR